jgi:transposase-like protein
LISRTAVSEVTERLWTEYEAFATRDLSEFVLAYLFVDGIAERLVDVAGDARVKGDHLADGHGIPRIIKTVDSQSVPLVPTSRTA